jgi:hypothetical protein
MSDPTEDQPADEDVMGTAGGPTTVPDATEADPEPENASSPERAAAVCAERRRGSVAGG